MVTMYQSSEREEAARQKLYEYNRELYGAVLDLLSILRASDDQWGASTDMPMPEPERLRRRAAEIERQDAIIRAYPVASHCQSFKAITAFPPNYGVDSTCYYL